MLEDEAPFDIDNINFDSINRDKLYEMLEECLPGSDEHRVCRYIQAMVYLLDEGFLEGVVAPDGTVRYIRTT